MFRLLCIKHSPNQRVLVLSHLMQPSQYASSWYHAAVVIISAYLVTSGSGLTHFLSVLFEEAELEALVQLQLPDVPHLMEMLPRGVELIQQTGHLAKSKN